MRRLLLLSNTTGYQATAFRQAAERMGMPIVLATDRCHVLEDPWQDGAIAVRFQEPLESAEKIADYARRYPISATTAIGDAPTLTAAYAAEALKLPYHPPHAVHAAQNKWLARGCYRAAGLPVPWYKRFPADHDPALAARDVPYPCVLKPLGLSASRGVIRANHEIEFLAAFERIRDLLSTADIQMLRDEGSAWIQVESYIAGQEFAVEGLVTDGRVRVLAIFDKPDPLEGPFFEETIYVTPSRLPDVAQQQICDCVQRAVSALGLRHGPIHAELRLNEQGPWMLEVAARPIGGLCARALRFGEGVPLEELILRHALGERVEDLPREACASGVMMIPIPASGAYEGVEGCEDALCVAGVEAVEITAKLRQKLVPLPEGASYLGFIFARGETPEFVEQALRGAHAKLCFEISPHLPVMRAS